MTPDFAIAVLTAALFGTGAAFAALAMIARFDTRRHRLREFLIAGTTAETAFLFDAETILDATEAGYALLSADGGSGGHRSQLVSALSPSFSGLDAALADLPERQRIILNSTDGQGALTLEWVEGLVRIRLSDTSAVTANSDRQSLRVIQEELTTLRAITDKIPLLVWKQEPDGKITWANRAYMDLVDAVFPQDGVRGWPLPRLFEMVALTQPSPTGRVRRASLRIAGAPERWFEIASCPLGEDILFTGAEADAVIKAETALRDFVQTLTKTFAHLTVGLAIFDRKRQLALFNPALTDLTQLPGDFLSRRPSLASFLDKMRERRMIPEPRDYTAWRRQLAELEKEAANSTYEDVWSLPTGQTFRVIGRAHPDGAVAFIFEDISAELSLTRRFRSELEMGQAVIDSLTDAIAVFAPSGVLALSNSAYARLWQSDPSRTLGTPTVIDAMALWGDACSPSPVWGEIRDYVHTHGDRAPWDDSVATKAGHEMLVRVTPLAGGSTMVAFSGPALDQDARDGGALGDPLPPGRALTAATG
jgi:PAS domain-containing protein